MTLNATRLIYVKRSFKYYRETHCVTCAFHGKFHAKSLRRLWQFQRPVPHRRGVSVCMFETKRNVSIRTLKSLNIVNLLKIDSYYTLWENKGGKIIFYRSSAKLIFTQIFKHQINSKLDVSESLRYNPIHLLRMQND